MALPRQPAGSSYPRARARGGVPLPYSGWGPLPSAVNHAAWFTPARTIPGSLEWFDRSNPAPALLCRGRVPLRLRLRLRFQATGNRRATDAVIRAFLRWLKSWFRAETVAAPQCGDGSADGVPQCGDPPGDGLNHTPQCGETQVECAERALCAIEHAWEHAEGDLTRRKEFWQQGKRGWAQPRHLVPIRPPPWSRSQPPRQAGITARPQLTLSCCCCERTLGVVRTRLCAMFEALGGICRSKRSPPGLGSASPVAKSPRSRPLA
jgi:hypothetical protein